MDVFIIFTLQSFHNAHVSQIITLYTCNIYNYICQWLANKAGIDKRTQGLSVNSWWGLQQYCRINTLVIENITTDQIPCWNINRILQENITGLPEEHCGQLVTHIAVFLNLNFFFPLLIVLVHNKLIQLYAFFHYKKKLSSTYFQMMTSTVSLPGCPEDTSDHSSL